MYRGQSGMWAWLLHRITGIGVLLFLIVHIVDISLLGFGPTVYNEGIALFGTPLVRIISLALIGAVFYHALKLFPGTSCVFLLLGFSFSPFFT